ncbi:MAG: hypothetical protein WBF13_09515 [Candidatus Zixiibacteriota bacterium]
MKFWKIGLAFLLTIIFLIFSRKTAAVRSVHETVQQHGISIQHNTVPKQVGDEIPVISARVEGDSEVRLVYKIGEEGEYTSVEMLPVTGEEKIFSASIPWHPKAVKAWYYLEASRIDEEGAVTVTLPQKSSGEVKPIRLKFEGVVPAYIVIPHVLCIFAAIFFAILTVFSAIDLKRGTGTLKKSVKLCGVTVFLLFLGFFPFGWAMNYFAFGVLWEAFPFGRDVTDNKSQIMLLFWLVTLFMVKGTLWGKGEKKNLVSHRVYSTLVIVSFVATVVILAIPHSV